MRTYLDCIPCFFKQALESARMAGANEFVQKKIMDEIEGPPAQKAEKIFREKQKK